MVKPTVTIKEVLGRSSQGKTEPFICRGDEGETYYVKGAGAGRRSLICEWVAAHLATAFDLPITDYAMAEVLGLPAIRASISIVWQRVFEAFAQDADNEYAMIDSTIGRSRGGLSTQIHTTVDALGNPTGFLLTPGQAPDQRVRTSSSKTHPRKLSSQTRPTTPMPG